MQEIIIDIMNQYGYLGVGLLITLENIFPPIPSEIVLTFGGFLTTVTSMNVWGVILSATAGSVLGAILLYTLGRVLTTERFERLLGCRVAKVLRLKRTDVTRAETWFLKHGKATIFFCRFVPILRSLISIPAGISKMKLNIFLPLTILGTFIWNVILVYLGRLAGDTWETIASYFDVYSMIALACIVLAVIIVGYIFIKKRFLKKQDD